MAGRHSAEYSIFTEPRHTTDITLPPTEWSAAGTMQPLAATYPPPVSAAQHSGRYTPGFAIGDPWDQNGRTV